MTSTTAVKNLFPGSYFSYDHIANVIGKHEDVLIDCHIGGLPPAVMYKCDFERTIHVRCNMQTIAEKVKNYVMQFIFSNNENSDENFQLTYVTIKSEGSSSGVFTHNNEELHKKYLNMLSNILQGDSVSVEIDQTKALLTTSSKVKKAEESKYKCGLMLKSLL